MVFVGDSSIGNFFGKTNWVNGPLVFVSRRMRRNFAEIAERVSHPQGGRLQAQKYSCETCGARVLVVKKTKWSYCELSERCLPAVAGGEKNTKKIKESFLLLSPHEKESPHHLYRRYNRNGTRS